MKGYERNICITMMLVCLIFTCSAQMDQGKFGVGHGKKILVTFFSDGKKVRIDNNFKLFFVNGGDTFRCKIKGIRAIPPEITRDSGYAVFFSYKNYVLTFEKLSRRMISADQDITWVFGIDNYPFHQSLDLLSSEKYKDAIETKVRQIQYLIFNLMEYGDGIQFIKKIQ